MDTRQRPTYFISHGGGPWSYMGSDDRGRHDRLRASLQAMPAEIGDKPQAVLIVSGHWEEPSFTVMANPQPPMLYDYYGFPEHTYHVHYRAPGAPALAADIAGLIDAAGLPAALDHERGFDHGAFVPMSVIYPQADVPVLQLSLRQGLDPREHLALGRALAPLRDRNVLIIGSGLSFHNLRLFGPASEQPSRAFDGWLDRTLQLPAVERDAALADWERAPHARSVHPREEHLLPLMVAAGAAGRDGAARIYHEAQFFGFTTVSSYRFGAAAGPA